MSMLAEPTTDHAPSTTTPLVCIIVGWYSVCRVTACAPLDLDEGGGSAVDGEASAPASSGGKTSGPERSSPELWAQGATKADCSVMARGPVTRTIVSRQCPSVSALPTHLSDTAMPPVYPIRPSITIVRRWSRLWKRVSLPKRAAL
jgi:hypothetical protein